MGHQRTVTGLADRGEFRLIVEDVARIAASHFGTVTPRRSEGFGASKAFKPEPGSSLRAWLERGYRDSQVLLPRMTRQPTFRRILTRIEEDAALL